MSRELKFRAWDKENKRILAWEDIHQYPMGYLNSDDGLTEHMQYTGLKDKNGKEIYEGDIVKTKDFSEKIGVIRFGKYKQNDMSNSYECGNLGFYIDFNDEHHLLRQDIYFWHGLGVEVIGNIYEHQNLLE